MRENIRERSSEELLTGAALGIGCFCVSIAATLATSYIAGFLIVLLSVPFVTAPGSQTLRNAGGGALLGVAALFLVGVVAKWASL